RYLFDTTNATPQNHIVKTNGLPLAATVLDQSYNDLTRQFYLRDTYTLLDDRLKLEFGAKNTVTTSTAKGKGGGYASGSLEARDRFLPQVGATYKLNAAMKCSPLTRKTWRLFRVAVTARSSPHRLQSMRRTASRA
ncbi:TonB-dependent receptor, partial [Pseudomonas syringae pv. spinaceae]